jgi:hypothetical protein
MVVGFLKPPARLFKFNVHQETCCYGNGGLNVNEDDVAKCEWMVKF